MTGLISTRENLIEEAPSRTRVPLQTGVRGASLLSLASLGGGRASGISLVGFGAHGPNAEYVAGADSQRDLLTEEGKEGEEGEEPAMRMWFDTLDPRSAAALPSMWQSHPQPAASSGKLAVPQLRFGAPGTPAVLERRERALSYRESLHQRPDAWEAKVSRNPMVSLTERNLRAVAVDQERVYQARMVEQRTRKEAADQRALAEAQAELDRLSGMLPESTSRQKDAANKLKSLRRWDSGEESTMRWRGESWRVPKMMLPSPSYGALGLGQARGGRQGGRQEHRLSAHSPGMQSRGAGYASNP